MSETKSPLGGLTRRGFLKTTGAVTAVAAVAGTGAALAPMPANAEGGSSADGEQTFRSACRGNCGSRCPLEVTVREGKVVKARPMDMPGEDAVRKRLKQPEEKFPSNIHRCGNTSSASVPLLLDELNRAGQLEEGDLLAISAFGAGLTTGSCVLRWGK